MSNVEIILDSAGILEVLKSEPVAREVHAIAEEKAERVRSNEAVQRNGVSDRVVVEDYETDRAASAIAILHPAGLPLQAKYGVLTKEV